MLLHVFSGKRELACHGCSGDPQQYCLALTHVLLFKERINQTVEIIKHTVDIEEKGVKLKLTIVDTPGFGDAVNNTEW